MLKRLLINKYRSCIDLDIPDIGGFMVFVGKNGVGKTNIFRALKIMANALMSGDVPAESPGDFEPYSVVVEVILTGVRIEYSLSYRTDFSADSEGHTNANFQIEEVMVAILDDGSRDPIFHRKNGRIDFSVGIPIPIDEKAMSSSAIIALLPTHVATPLVKEFVDYFRSVSYNHLDTPSVEDTTRFILGDDFARWQKSSGAPSKAPRVSETELRLLDLKLKNPSRFDELVSILSQMRIVSSFDIGELVINSAENTKFHFFNWLPTFQPAGNTRGWNELSFGTRRLIKLFVAFFYQDDKIFMLEQPEDGIHAGLLHEILPMLRVYGADKQIFIATHSAEVMNAASPDEIRIVYTNSGVTQVRRLTSDELSSACSYLQNEGPLFDFLTMIEE